MNQSGLEANTGEHVNVYICKDHRNEIEAPDSVEKDLISYKIMKQFYKYARLIHGTKTTIFVKYPIF